MRNISLTTIITTTTVTTGNGAGWRIQKIKMKKPASKKMWAFFWC
nr:thr operon leader peptide [Providencia rustigianii]